MRFTTLILPAMLALTLAACSKPEPNSVGNGPGNADGLGGRADPPAAPADQGTSAPPSDTASENAPPSDAQGEPGTAPAPTPQE